MQPLINLLKLLLSLVFKLANKLYHWLRKLYQFLFSSEWAASSITMLCVFIIAFLSMGLLGMLLYYLVMPVTILWLPHLNELSGDWMWPAFIGIGMLWSFSFLIAGIIDHKWVKKVASKSTRRWTYLFILWFCAFILWASTISAHT